MGTVFYLQPLGRGEQVRWASAQKKKDDILFWQNLDVWKVPTFETWCAATMYDPNTRKDSTFYPGGALFHDMLKWHLTVKPDGKVHKLDKGKVKKVPYKFDGSAETQFSDTPYPLLMNKRKPQGLRPLASIAAYYPDTWKEAERELGYLPANVYQMANARGLAPSRPGESVAYSGFRSGNWTDKNNVQAMGYFKDLHVATGAQHPASGLNWFETAGVGRDLYMDTDDNCAANDNQSRTIIGAVTGQSNGCVNYGTRVAAYFGLYCYEGADAAAHNWHEIRTLPDNHEVTVRHRVPNPAYDRNVSDKVGRLRVVEDAAGQQTDDAKIIGGTARETGVTNKKGKEAGFYFPEATHRISWDQLAIPDYGKDNVKTENKEKKLINPNAIQTRMAPWGGKSDNGELGEVCYGEKPLDKEKLPASLYIMDNWVQRCDGPFEGHMYMRREYKKGKHLAFGWSLPSSQMLNAGLGDERKQLVRKPLEGTPVSWYQPWPEPRNPGDVFAVTNDVKTTFGVLAAERPFYAVLKDPPKLDDKNRILFAYGRTATQYHTQNEYGVSEAFHLELQYKTPSTPAVDVGTGQPPLLVTGTEEAAATTEEVTEEADNEAAPEDTARTAGNEVLTLEVTDPDEFPRALSLHAALGEEEGMDMGDVDTNDPKKMREVYSNKEKEAKAKLEKDGDLGFTEDGAARRSGDTTGNHHLFSNEHVPWSNRDVYMPNQMDWDTEDMTDEDMKKYAEIYGSTANLFLRSSSAVRIKGTKQQLGDLHTVASYVKMHTTNNSTTIYKGKTFLCDLPIDSWRDTRLPGVVRDLFARNMRRILAIYYDESGDLGYHKKQRITNDEKRKGMLNGIYLKAPKNGFKSGKGTVAYEGSAKDRVLPPVFKKAPGQKHAAQFPLGYLDNTDAASEAVNKGLDGLAGILPGNNPDFTVMHWLQSPWHYEYLPFRDMASCFTDNETHCAGCTRCARPFYEHEYQYIALPTEPRSAYMSHVLWRHDSDGYDRAPRPFHDAAFWSTSLETPFNKPKNVPGELRSKVQGYHGWPTRAFLLGWYQKKDSVVKLPGQSVHLTKLFGEWAKRVKKKTWLVTRHTKGTKLMFRQYLNSLYPGKDGNRPLVQGVVRPNAKAAYGMSGYMLQRSIRYGNVCRDCAITLDLMGKYMRSGTTTGTFAELMHRRRDDKRGFDTWWLRMVNAPLKDENGTPLVDDDGLPVLFHPWFIYMMTTGAKAYPGGEERGVGGGSRAKVQKALGLDEPPVQLTTFRHGKPLPLRQRLQGIWPDLEDDELMRLYEAHMQAAQAIQQKENCQFKQLGKHLTKMHHGTEIFIQKAWEPKREGMDTQSNWDGIAQKQVKEAQEVLGKLLAWLDSGFYNREGGKAVPLDKQPSLPPIDLKHVGNRALRDCLHDAKTLMASQAVYKPDDRVPKLDPDYVREEQRNVQRTRNGKTYNNCLVVKQMHAFDVNKQKKGKEGQFYVKTYYYDTKHGAGGTSIDPKEEHDWRGDKYVERTQRPEQRRPWTQTRVMITYSLHRPVKDEMEARFVMERMANAVRRVFGEDQQLCKMVKFGWMLNPTEKKDSKDIISKKDWVLISAPKKASKDFYGDIQSTSYTSDTYGTHVDSVTVDAGVEIGPNRHHPHFHCLVTINHFSYIHIDTYVMKHLLEELFKGKHVFYPNDEEKDREARAQFELLDGRGDCFYCDNENPYVKIELKATDDFQQVLAAYVRKSSTPGIMESLKARNGM